MRTLLAALTMLGSPNHLAYYNPATSNVVRVHSYQRLDDGGVRYTETTFDVDNLRTGNWSYQVRRRWK